VDDVGTLVATITSSSDVRMTSARPSLLWATVATNGFWPSLLCYQYSNIVVATGRMPMATMAYGPLVQWCVVVVTATYPVG
jgi:hypothetical protein